MTQETLTPVADFHIQYNDTTAKNFELRNAATCLQYLLPKLEALHPTFSLLDIGCGPGSITFDLARRFPQAKIVGLDQDEKVIARNRANIERYTPGTNLEFRTGDVLRPDTFLRLEERGGFDVVHEHTTLICIPDSAPVLKQMKALAKSNGGIVACRDGDTQSQIVWPPCPESDELQERLYRMKGLETQMGRRLISKALAAGFRREQITASASTITTVTRAEREAYAGSMLNMLADENSEYRRAAKEFEYSEGQVEVLRQNMRRFIERDDAWRLLICTEIICRMD